MDDQPTIEQRIRAAMTLAGIDFPELARRIDTPNYGERTLRKIADPEEQARSARGPDLHLIARACGVSDGFWTADFSQLNGVSTAEEISRLSAAVAQLAADVARQATEMQEHRDRDHRGGSQSGGGQ